MADENRENKDEPKETQDSSWTLTACPWESSDFSWDSPVWIPPPKDSRETAVSSELLEEYRQEYLLEQVSEREARSALMGYVVNQACFGKTAVRLMNIDRIEHSVVYQYRFQTFTEKRGVLWKYVPYAGGEIDKANRDKVPNIWEIPAEPAEMFCNEEKNMEIPHTSSTRKCPECKGKGNLNCERCNGEDKDCWTCKGEAKYSCSKCDGYTLVRCFASLKISWELKSSEYLDGQLKVPIINLRCARGQVILKQQAKSLSSPSSSQDEDFLGPLQSLKAEHERVFSEERVLQQRQQVKATPVNEVFFTYKSRSSSFWVYGYDHNVYAPKYPGRYTLDICTVA